MKYALSVTIAFALSACASFTPGTRVAPGFPDDPLQLSLRTDAPPARLALNTKVDRTRL